MLYSEAVIVSLKSQVIQNLIMTVYKTSHSRQEMFEALLLLLVDRWLGDVKFTDCFVEILQATASTEQQLSQCMLKAMNVVIPKQLLVASGLVLMQQEIVAIINKLSLVLVLSNHNDLIDLYQSMPAVAQQVFIKNLSRLLAIENNQAFIKQHCLQLLLNPNDAVLQASTTELKNNYQATMRCELGLTVKDSLILLLLTLVTLTNCNSSMLLFFMLPRAKDYMQQIKLRLSELNGTARFGYILLYVTAIVTIYEACQLYYKGSRDIVPLLLIVGYIEKLIVRLAELRNCRLLSQELTATVTAAAKISMAATQAADVDLALPEPRHSEPRHLKMA